MFDWTAFETAFAETAEAAVNKWLTKNSKHHVYAIAFHEGYYELDGVIAIPSLGINSLEKLKLEANANKEDCDEAANEEGVKWSPGDWRWTSILPNRSALSSFEGPLKDEACRGSQAHWRKTKKSFDKVLLNVTKQLYLNFAKHPQVTEDFVVYIEDEEGGLELIKRCVPARLYKKHFSQLQTPDVGKPTRNDKLTGYLKEMFTHQKQIVALGSEAIAPLVKKLNDSKDGCVAARLLADINQPTTAVINALRKHARTQGSTGSHSALALRLLGDVEFLYGLLDNKALVEQVVDGILEGLNTRATGREPHIALDYSHVERLLAMQSPAIDQCVVEALKPGRSFIQIKPSDVDEALRGLASPHLVIRQHAACVSGDRSLGKAAGQRLLPALADKLTDPVPNVRRLALLALSNWKAAAVPYHAAMKKLRKDKDRLVREYANAVFAR